MIPPQLPLPTAWNLSFHPSDGNQTSILISESDDGDSVAATRQKGVRVANACPAEPSPMAGLENPSGTTLSARVIVVCVSLRDARLSHDDAAEVGVDGINNAKVKAVSQTVVSL